MKLELLHSSLTVCVAIARHVGGDTGNGGSEGRLDHAAGVASVGMTIGHPTVGGVAQGYGLLGG